MGLREQAAADLRAIVGDQSAGFGWPITVINPDGVSADMSGLSTDVSQVIDPETGQAVMGRAASVALALADLDCAGLGVPTGAADTRKKPWRIAFKDIGGRPHTFKVLTANPDRAIGVVTCTLEAYVPG